MVLEEASLLWLFGIFSLVLGLAFRLGRRRGAARWYFDEDSPWYLRNFAFGVLPGAGFWLFGGAALVMFDRVAEWAAWMAVAASLSSALVALAFTYRPPEVSKPQWLKEEERVRGAPVTGPEHRRGLWMVIDRFGLAIMVFVVGAALAVAVMMIAIEATG